MKINLGCGEDYREEYVNTDIRTEVQPDIALNALDLPFQSNKINKIVAQDILEHFEEPVKALKEWKRVLSDDGILVVRVPDWHRLMSDSYWEDTEPREVESDVYGGHKNPFDQHHTLWAKKLAHERFKEAGFNEIIFKQIRTKPVDWHLVIITGTLDDDEINQAVSEVTQEL